MTGGYRYRGTAFPTLFARYFYGDFCAGKIWAGTEAGGGAWTTQLLLDTALSISSFGEDEQGEIYVVHIGTSGASFTDGAVFRIAVPAASGEIILDNLAAGQSDGMRTFTGTWCTSTVAGLGPDTLYACGGSSESYRWRPTIPSAGTYQVFARWGAHANRSTNVPYRIVHAGGTTMRAVNQRINGGMWNLLGTFSFNAGSTGYVEVLEATGGVTSADAVRFVPGAGATPIVVDNLPVGQQDAARTFTGTWCTSALAGFGADTLYACGGAGESYRWRPTVPATGTYRVFEQHAAHSNRGTAVPFRISHAGGLTTVNVNQQVNGGQWNLLGQFMFNAGTAGYVEVLEAPSGITSADAIRLEAVP